MSSNQRGPLAFISVVVAMGILALVLIAPLVTPPSSGAVGGAPHPSLLADDPSPSTGSTQPDPSEVRDERGPSESGSGPQPTMTYPWVGGQRSFPAEGFEIGIPEHWSIYEDGKSIRIRGPGTSLTIRVGRADGQLLTCQEPARPWERCRNARITNLDGFREAVAVGLPPGRAIGACREVGQGGRRPSPVKTPWTLGSGDTSTRLTAQRARATC